MMQEKWLVRFPSRSDGLTRWTPRRFKRSSRNASGAPSEPLPTDGSRKRSRSTPSKIDRVAELLKSDPTLAFECLSNLSAVDYPTRESIQVVYNLFSYKQRHRAHRRR
jgi:NADH:ubiquinone oxidoreductase subunit C